MRAPIDAEVSKGLFRVVHGLTYVNYRINGPKLE